MRAGQEKDTGAVSELSPLPKPQPVNVHRRDPMIVPADAPITQTIYTMQHACRSFVVVADEEGRHVGIITVKDLVEEIVGELEAW